MSATDGSISILISSIFYFILFHTCDVRKSDVLALLS